MDETTARQARYWNRFTDGSGRWRSTDRHPPGQDLAAMRRGAGREPGTVPAMWPFHSEIIGDDWLRGHRTSWDTPARFAAEHHCLALYGFHQQSAQYPVHVARVGLGTAVLRLRQRGNTASEGVDRRFAAAATAATLSELSHHLRRLVALLKGAHASLDYNRLLEDLSKWEMPAMQGRVRRAWGLQYYARPRDEDASEPAQQESRQ